ncbi:HAD superfamily hydrolase (TIGR01509 family) [Murinocardiopsis flavida]|uniref:HAD superfamily hydrolase (TIGR01509 family) n=1 Tax=Murinocardiopsis flavida TaxID=645275 RepID=A0A2P8DLJ2_9ACTN|nr:HAD family phosphatase [Murinocardiopsis flavida]PSK98090.1 HAD superfamily hydrolase (TIGR01509 family) [Murinocardiopsis flavida]
MPRSSPQSATLPDLPGGPALQAVLFDMDGTLIESEGLWMQTEREVAAVLGGDWTEADQQINLGGSVTSVARYMIETTGSDRALDSVVAMLETAFKGRLAGGAEIRPGAAALLAEVAASQIPAALVTSTHRGVIGTAIARLGVHHFDLVVAGDEVAHNKPHPEPYLKAARLLGVDPARCAAIEDSPAGIASAQAAGCVTVAVPHMAPVEPAPGRIVVESLTDIDLDWLQRAASV